VTKIQSLGVDNLIEFAKIDGATFIDDNGNITYINVTIRAKQPTKRTLFSGRGARHEAAESISKKVPNALVVVVSENRGISLVSDGGKRLVESL
jgi:DNA integrity scanning protein DisA with diadenylate cyclase activity